MQLVTIIVPVYNTAPYLRKCLDSLVAQTHRPIEIIAVDDGSTDGSPAILAEYAQANS
ncbi:MAG: glycosyltransferase family 2 protein, partial [Rectinemataceae bacterium]